MKCLGPNKHRYVILLLLFSSALFAQPPQNQGGLSLAVGLGALFNDESYREMDRETRAIPLIQLRYKRFSFQGTTAAFQLVQKSNWGLSLFASPVFDGFEADDSPVFAGMEERKLSGLAGLQWGFDLGKGWEIEAGYGFDISDVHQGSDAELSLSKSKRGQRYFVSASVFAQYNDAKFLDYYYGVRQAEVTATRPFYEADSDTGYGAGVVVQYNLTPKLGLFTFINGTAIPDQVKDSPLVDSDMQFTSALGLTWKFR